MTGPPHRALDIAREAGQATLARLPHHDGPVRSYAPEADTRVRADQPRSRVPRQNRPVHRRDGDALIRPRNRVGPRKAAENLVLPLDAGKIRLAGGTDAVPGLANAEYIGRPKSGRRWLRSVYMPVSYIANSEPPPST
jgi:hypothetical protein